MKVSSDVYRVSVSNQKKMTFLPILSLSTRRRFVHLNSMLIKTRENEMKVEAEERRRMMA